MALRYFSKRIISSCNKFSYVNPFFKHSSSFCALSVLPIQVRRFHLSENLFKELVRFNLADIGEGIKDVLIKEWYIKVGDRVCQFDNICEVQSDKATVTITSRYDGLVKKLYYAIEETALVGKPLIDIEVDSPMEDDTHGTEVVCESNDTETLESLKGIKVSTTPSVRKMAKEQNINLAEVIPTGPHGRILKEDLVVYMKQKSHLGINEKVSPSSFEKVVEMPSIPKPSVFIPKVEIQTEDKIVSLTKLQKTMLKTMNKSRSIPDFGFYDEINVSKLSEIKNSLSSNNSDIKITFMPFFIKALSNAILKFPQLNAQLDEPGENIIYKAEHNIGFAVDSPIGLVVPKIHSAQLKSIIEISSEMNHLISKSKQGKLTTADLSNGTITLSNIGSIGGTYASPIILSPEIVIGAIGKIQTLPRFNEKGDVVPVQIVQVSWSADHRVLDGATIARFSNLWKLYLEKPEMLLLNLR